MQVGERFDVYESHGSTTVSTYVVDEDLIFGICKDLLVFNHVKVAITPLDKTRLLAVSSHLGTMTYDEYQVLRNQKLEQKHGFS
jgi:hypothetical protein